MVKLLLLSLVSILCLVSQDQPEGKPEQNFIDRSHCLILRFSIDGAPHILLEESLSTRNPLGDFQYLELSSIQEDLDISGRLASEIHDLINEARQIQKEVVEREVYQADKDELHQQWFDQQSQNLRSRVNEVLPARLEQRYAQLVQQMKLRLLGLEQYLKSSSTLPSQSVTLSEEERQNIRRVKADFRTQLNRHVESFHQEMLTKTLSIVAEEDAQLRRLLNESLSQPLTIGLMLQLLHTDQEAAIERMTRAEMYEAKSAGERLASYFDDSRYLVELDGSLTPLSGANVLARNAASPHGLRSSIEVVQLLAHGQLSEQMEMTEDQQTLFSERTKELLEMEHKCQLARNKTGLPFVDLSRIKSAERYHQNQTLKLLQSELVEPQKEQLVHVLEQARIRQLGVLPLLVDGFYGQRLKLDQEQRTRLKQEIISAATDRAETLKRLESQLVESLVASLNKGNRQLLRPTLGPWSTAWKPNLIFLLSLAKDNEPTAGKPD